MDRYKSAWTRQRAQLHFMLTGSIVFGILSTFGPWGWLGLLFPVALEAYQAATDAEYNYVDGTFDLFEHLAGGLVYAGAYYLLRWLF